MKLWEIAHSRSGDKGNISNISLIVYDKKHYPYIEKYITPEVASAWFSNISVGTVVRYELPQLGALNFVLHDALSGGVTSSITLDKHGKTLSSHLLNMEVNKEHLIY
tara:strand:- start:1652 stop:1972 length:321 start_codon:yes stop_codon:yes gene_type:complete